MARYTHIRNNFLYGEVSPNFYGRTDLQQYNQMCKSLKNFTVLPQGGIRKRKGTKFLDADNFGVGQLLIPFTGSNDERYIVGIFGSDVAIYRVSTNTVFNPTSVAIEGVSSPVSSFEAYAKKGTQYTQHGDSIIFTNNISEPLQLTRTGDAAFELSSVLRKISTGTNNIHTRVPFFSENTSATTITATGTLTVGGTATLTASAAIFSSDMFQLGKLGTYFRIRSGSTIGVGRVNGYTSSTVLTVLVEKQLPSGAQTAWSESQWSTRNGFPRACSFYQGRIFYAGTKTAPDTVWGSQINDIYELSIADPTATPTVSDAFNITQDVGSINKINFISPGAKLFTGGSTREVIMETIDNTQSLGVNNTQFVPQTVEGSVYTMPVRYANLLTFADRTGNGLKELVFDLREDSYKSTDLRYFSEHMFPKFADAGDSYDKTGTSWNATNSETISTVCYQHSERLIWALVNGRLYSCTRDREHDVLAWHRHILGGTDSHHVDQHRSLDPSTEPYIANMCVSSDPATGKDFLYLIVIRDNLAVPLDVNIQTLEVLENHPITDETTINGAYLDCVKSATNGSPQTTWTNLHPTLGSCVVSVIADGVYIGEKTLSSSGTLTLTTAASRVSVGLGYTSELVTTALQSNALFGTGLAQIKRTEEIAVLFSRTSSAKFGVETADALQPINFREAGVASGAPTPLFTGEKIFKLNATYETNQCIKIQSTEPVPCTIDAVIAKGILYD